MTAIVKAADSFWSYKVCHRVAVKNVMHTLQFSHTGCCLQLTTFIMKAKIFHMYVLWRHSYRTMFVILFLILLLPCSWWASVSGAWSGEARLVLHYSDTNVSSANSISSLFSYLMLQWSSSTHSCVTLMTFRSPSLLWPSNPQHWQYVTDRFRYMWGVRLGLFYGVAKNTLKNKGALKVP